MIITYQGAEFFKVQYGDTVLAFNPISKDSKLKGSKFGADLALSTVNHSDMNGIDAVTFGEKKPFAVTGPGEYEFRGIFIKGLPSTSDFGGEKRINTIYLVSLENINLCFLGALSDKVLPGEIAESIDDVDILFVPIGGDGVLDASSAYKLAVTFEPKLIIPMHYGNLGAKNALDQFLKEGGADSSDSTDKLTIKKKDLEGKEGVITVLKPVS